MLTKKEAITSNIYTSKLLFFLNLSSHDLVNEDLDGYILEEKFKKKEKLFDGLENRKDEEILFKEENIKYFEENNGEKGEELKLNVEKKLHS